jgi:hypothetical protein
MPIQESATRLRRMNTRTDPRQLALAARLASLKQVVLVVSAGLAMTFWWLVAPAATTTNATTASATGDGSSASTTDEGSSTFFGDDDAGSARSVFGSTSVQVPVLRSHGS